jgi:hypothetical protein
LAADASVRQIAAIRMNTLLLLLVVAALFLLVLGVVAAWRS